MSSPIARAVVVVLMCATPAAGVSFQPDAPGVNGFTTVDRVTWKDSKGLDREFYFAKSYPNAIAPGLKGYVTRLTWQPDLTHARIIAEEDPSGINTSTSQGWGLNVMHMHWLEYGGVDPIFGSGQSATTGKRDGFDFHQAPVLLGPHHLIFRVTYKQYTTLQKATPDDRKWVQVTTDWFFADGLDFVVFAHTVDATAGIESDPVRFLNNTLAPYSVLAAAGWKGTTDWAGGTDAPDGQSFGDFKVFVTNDMGAWTYGGTNTIPFVWEWVTPLSGRGDAEAAFVQTETYAQKNAGEGFAWGQDAQGTRLPQYPDLNGQECAYQMNFFDSYGTKRMTWGTQLGALYGGYGSTRGYQNYSLAMLLGKYSEHGASALIRETESIHDGMLQVRALVGTLVTSGPEGSGNATTHVYSPAGYNHVYRTWEARAEGNVLRLRFDAGPGTFKRPTLVVRGFTASEATVMLNGAPAEVSATLDDAGDVLWVTLLSTLSGSNEIDVTGVGACAPSCPAGSCGGDGCGGTCACAAGAVCLADLTCCQPNAELCGPDGCGGSHGECACTPNDATCGPDGCGGTHGECPPVCTPVCAPGSCGGDGCAGTCACASGAVCLADGTCCQPNTAACGPDGCGGTHGECPPGCTPSCAPQSCGGDGCGGICVCTSGTVCLTDGTCCQPNTASCGPDGCGGTHGVCPPVCTPACAPQSCGGDGCGGICVCTSGTVCLADATCCQPNTATCGPDGCGGTHGDCPACTPNTNACGPDGCGGTHGPGWDPGFGTFSSTPTTTRVQFSVHDTTVVTLKLEIGGAAPRTLWLGSRTALSGGYLRFTATASPAIAADTMVRLKATQSLAAGAKTATSTWFAYLQGAPALTCEVACVPACLPETCGSDGCGGTCGCATDSLCLGGGSLMCCHPNSNACGPDGCGGTHGACPPSCTAGDADGDGVCDDRDNCRGCWNADQADVDRDGLGECWRCDWCSGPGTDTDWDGFCDRVDDCPATWNQSQFDRDGDGLGDACDPTP